MQGLFDQPAVGRGRVGQLVGIMVREDKRRDPRSFFLSPQSCSGFNIHRLSPHANVISPSRSRVAPSTRLIPQSTTHCHGRFGKFYKEQRHPRGLNHAAQCGTIGGESSTVGATPTTTSSRAGSSATITPLNLVPFFHRQGSRCGLFNWTPSSPSRACWKSLGFPLGSEMRHFSHRFCNSAI